MFKKCVIFCKVGKVNATPTTNYIADCECDKN